MSGSVVLKSTCVIRIWGLLSGCPSTEHSYFISFLWPFGPAGSQLLGQQEPATEIPSTWPSPCPILLLFFLSWASLLPSHPIGGGNVPRDAFSCWSWEDTWEGTCSTPRSRLPPAGVSLFCRLGYCWQVPPTLVTLKYRSNHWYWNRDSSEVEEGLSLTAEASNKTASWENLFSVFLRRKYMCVSWWLWRRMTFDKEQSFCHVGWHCWSRRRSTKSVGLGSDDPAQNP